MSAGPAHGEVAIRPAAVSDAAGIAAVHIQAWREAYVGMIPQEVLDRRDQDVSVERWARNLASSDRGQWVAVASGDRIVGWATAGPSRDDDAPTALELYGLYILRECYDRGVGRRLLESALGTAEPASLWVLKANSRAIAFYERQGFRPDGTEKAVDFLDMPDVVPEIRMRRPAGRG